MWRKKNDPTKRYGSVRGNVDRSTAANSNKPAETKGGAFDSNMDLGRQKGGVHEIKKEDVL